MFEDGARIDDILNVFKKPTLDKNKVKTEQGISDSAIRYESQKSVGDDSIKFDFAKNSGGLL
ncbi:MAG: hypothetical protein IJQ82_09715 [Selenomonadaceae bacterium]|nr:hypothetical protein [Selenomonadaceae bacterium]